MLKYKFKPSKTIILYEIVGFSIIILFLWVDEIFDVPHYLFGSMETPVNTVESIFESIMILIIAIFCIKVTIHLLTQIKILEGRIPICASCKKIRDNNGHWLQIEKYIENHSNASFTHGLCQECMDKLYGHETWYKKKENCNE